MWGACRFFVVKHKEMCHLIDLSSDIKIALKYNQNNPHKTIIYVSYIFVIV